MKRVEKLNKIVISILAFLLVGGEANAKILKGKASHYRSKGHAACAHRTLPFGTKVRVTNLANGRTAMLVVNDRGPFIKGRIIDVSTHTADRLGFRRAGIADVSVEPIPN
jgi:rare lipoprotein A